MSTHFIYGLIDPRKRGEFRVIGMTTLALSQRLSAYVCNARRQHAGGQTLTPSAAWVLDLTEQGIRPEICLLRECTALNWREFERKEIAAHRAAGHRLLNKHAGGNGRSAGPTSNICGTCGSIKKALPSGRRYCSGCRVRFRRIYDRNYRQKRAANQILVEPASVKEQ